VIWILMTLACGGGDEKDSAALDTDAQDTAAPAGFCSDVPLLSWENFGEGLLIEHCQACHASDAPYRQGDDAPPEGVFFDTYEDAMGLKSRILAVSIGDAPTMPPRGGLSELDRARLEIWLRCGETD